MKKIIALLLFFAFVISFTACDNPTPKELSCEDIIKAYENSGYNNVFHLHSDGDNQISGGEECYLIIHENERDDSDLVEIKIFYTEADAKEAADFDRYHVVKWMIAVVLGEGRWLKSGQYGKIEYSSYSREMLKPLKELMK